MHTSSPRFRTYLERIGMPRIRFHDLQHTYITLLRSEGIAQEIVQQIAGHASAEMTEHYTHFGLEKQEAASNIVALKLLK